MITRSHKDVNFIIDTSGSCLTTFDIPFVKNYINSLHANDFVSMYTFNHSLHNVFIHSSPHTTSFESIEYGGPSAVYDCLFSAFSEIEQRVDPLSHVIVYILSDYVDNYSFKKAKHDFELLKASKDWTIS